MPTAKSPTTSSPIQKVSGPAAKPGAADRCCGENLEKRTVETGPRSPPIHAAIPPSEAGQNLVADGGRLVREVVDVDVIAEQSNESAAAHRFLGQCADVDRG